MKKAKGNSEPSSLFHYTKLSSLEYILPSSKEDIIDGVPYMDFRFSSPYQCNDPMEVHFFTDALYTSSDVSNKLKSDVEKEKERIGSPFIFCLIHHKRAEMQKCPLTEIPMWNMYGDKNQGIRLRLDYKQLKKHCKEQQIELFPCIYLNKDKMQKETQAIREKMKSITEESQRVEEYQDIYHKYVRYKTLNWSYEYEHRMAVWTKNFETIGEKLYYHIKIPLQCLKAIQIGSSADYEMGSKFIDDKKVIIQQLGFSTDFKVEKSKLLIR